MKRTTTLAAIAGALLFILPTAGAAQQAGRFSLSILAGFNSPSGSGQTWDLFFDNLVLQPSDLGGAAFEAEVGFRLVDRLEMIGGVEMASGEAVTTFRRQSSLVQTTNLEVGPGAYGGARLNLLRLPLGGARGIGLYVMGGAGKWLDYNLRQSGDFFDQTVAESFQGNFETEGSAFYGFAGSGINLDLSRSLFLQARARYHFSEADLGGDFSDLESLDLSAFRLSAGLGFRF